jgi:hypothetical protein
MLRCGWFSCGSAVHRHRLCAHFAPVAARAVYLHLRLGGHSTAGRHPEAHVPHCRHQRDAGKQTGRQTDTARRDGIQRFTFRIADIKGKQVSRQVDRQADRYQRDASKQADRPTDRQWPKLWHPEDHMSASQTSRRCRRSDKTDRCTVKSRTIAGAVWECRPTVKSPMRSCGV